MREHFHEDNSHHQKASSLYDLAITEGSQDALTKTFDMLLDTGDTLLLESPTYSGSLAYLHAKKNVHLESVTTDDGGLCPEALSTLLSHWHSAPATKTRRFPKVLYVIPTGSNPTGASLSLARKQAIYALACRYNLLLLEDDPYYYLQLNNNCDDAMEKETAHAAGTSLSSHSFLSMDTQQRVCRFDSFIFV